MPCQRKIAGLDAHRIIRRRKAFGQAQIHHLHVAVKGEHDIGRLEVAVNDSPRMSDRERFRYLSGDRYCVIDGDGAAGEPFPQRFTVDVRHRDIGFAVCLPVS